MENQVNSKERTAKFGEVHTASREVNAMIDLIEEDARNLSSRILEHACGDFLSERKVDENQNRLDEPIEFIGWTFTGGSKVEMETVLLSDMSCPEGGFSICDFFEREDAPVDVLDYRS